MVWFFQLIVMLDSQLLVQGCSCNQYFCNALVTHQDSSTTWSCFLFQLPVDKEASAFRARGLLSSRGFTRVWEFILYISRKFYRNICSKFVSVYESDSNSAVESVIQLLIVFIANLLFF